MMLVDNQTELGKFIAMGSSSGSFVVFKPHIRTAERRFLKPVLGPQFVLLITAKESNDQNGIAAKLKELLELAQEASANLAMALAVSSLSVDASDAGIKRIESDTQKTAYQYQEINLRNDYVQRGYDAINEMLILMEENPEDFPEWISSDIYKRYQSQIIRSGAHFDAIYAIRNPQFTFLRICYLMPKIEEFYLRKALSADLFDKLKDGLEDEEQLSDAYKNLLNRFVRPAMALFTMSNAVIERMVDVDDFGVSINIIQENNNSQQKQAASLEKIKEVSAKLFADAQHYLSLMADELALNPDDYPDYEAPTTNESLFNIENKQENGFYTV